MGVKTLLKIVGLSIVLGCLVMGFTYKRSKEIIHAIGGTEGIPRTMQRALTPGKAFEPLPEPKQGEWLAEHPEPGQTSRRGMEVIKRSAAPFFR